MKTINKKELHEIFAHLRIEREESFNELYLKYRPLVYGIAFSLLKQKENSEDVVQNVFTKIYKTEAEKLPTEKEASWLYTLTKNETLNYIRKQKNIISMEEVEEIHYSDKELETIIEKESYLKIMKNLEGIDREIVSLRVLADMKFKDIAALLNMPIGTIQWKYYTALHHLKIILGNLSMTILGVVLFFANEAYQKKLSEENHEAELPSEENEIKEETEGNFELGSSITNDLDGNRQTETENQQNESIVNDIEQDEIEQNEIMEETIDNTVVTKNNQLQVVDIGILFFTFFFLIATILSVFFSLRHYQKK